MGGAGRFHGRRGNEAAEHIKDFKATLLVNFRVKSASIFALCVGKKKLFEKAFMCDWHMNAVSREHNSKAKEKILFNR